MTTPSDVTVSDQHAETWKPLPAPFSKYEWRADGFGPDQRPIRRADAAAGLATTVSNHGGYLMVKPYDDDGKRQTRSVHSLVLLGGAGPCPAGLQSRHLDDDPLNNRWAPGATDDEVRANGGNLVYGSGPQNAADKYRRGLPRTPAATHPCINHDRCGGLVANPGRRCLPCAQEVGVQAAALLNKGVNLKDVTARLGYQTPEWVHKLARNHGGYAGTLAVALAQRPPRARRVTATLRGYFGRGRR